VTSAIKTSSASDRLQALGLDLPSLGSSSKYVNHRTVDSSIYISGQLPYEDGERWASALSAGTSRWRRREGLRARPRSTRWPSLRRRSGLWTGSGSCRCSFSWPVRRSGVLVLRGAWTQTLATGWRARPGPRPAAGRRCGAVAARVASDAPSTASNSPVESVSMCRASASSASEPDSRPPITSATKTVPVMASTISNACGAGRSRSSRGNASARASARVPSPCDSSSAA
jgi:hypothetical protein